MIAAPARRPGPSRRRPLLAATAAGLALLAGAACAAPDGGKPPGVADTERAWQNWTLNCQGCHRPDGSGSAATAPPLKGLVARFLWAPGGREYLGRVPGVAGSSLGDADLAEVLNWMLWRFDARDVPPGFAPYTAEEVARLRDHPLRLTAAAMRRRLLDEAARRGR